jgi:hypothetical protein
MAVQASIKSKNYAVVVRSLKASDAAVLPAIAISLKDALLQAVGVIQMEYLQGPRPAKLGEITGRLRNSINSDVFVSNKGVVGRIGTNLSYGAFHEFGFHGTENVRAHTRVTSVVNQKGATVPAVIFQKKGKEIVAKRRSLGRLAQQPGNFAARTQQVRAHTRKIDYDGRPFVRPGLEQTLPNIQAQVDKAVATALKSGGNSSGGRTS